MSGGRFVKRGLLVLSVLWLAFVLFLDFRYGMFPGTTLGGLKILAAALALAVLFYVGVRLVFGRAARKRKE